MYKILDFLEDKAMDASDFFDAFSGLHYDVTATLGQLEKQRRQRAEGRLNYQVEREQRRRLQKYLCKLKKDDLISENSSGKIYLSKEGRQRLSFLKQKQKNIVNKNYYKKEIGDKVIVVSYDIPETHKRERNILRDILKILGFNMIHKSVWVGKVKIPKHFILDLEIMGILDDVEILEVTKSGSLKMIS